MVVKTPSLLVCVYPVDILPGKFLLAVCRPIGFPTQHIPPLSYGSFPILLLGRLSFCLALLVLAVWARTPGVIACWINSFITMRQTFVLTLLATVFQRSSLSFLSLAGKTVPLYCFPIVSFPLVISCYEHLAVLLRWAISADRRQLK